MELKNVEVELTFLLPDVEEAAKILSEFFEKKAHQKDTYYVPKHKNFLEQKPLLEWLRVRETENGCSFCYKKWHKSEGAVSCDEFETKVDDVESLKSILENLDFKEIIVVEKDRRLYNYKNVEIALDEIKDLGFFIELESKGDFESVDQAKEYLHKILEELKIKVGEQDFKGYPKRVLEKQGYKFN